ncbi:MAG: UDP-N-acetylmuramoyl-tripeptide--D-alanyl-D-alanine ligase [Gammaproteobacteria bacterium]|nr:UDP-N-acetylmuramoyl-tripeptide--D-alanyl-D-alanine ligase [Gammaproteobacteria bacterium]MDH5691531.1 UDP-N-acetylmuramoyl-tripeptide--D-alanyl-D-alanine ligase [Gammaproteobacteria bacterium]
MAVLSKTMNSVASVLGSSLIGVDVPFSTVSTDTRSLEQGALFVALSGPNFDGNDYVNIAGEKGAVGAVLSRDVETGLPYVVVSDTKKAIGILASAWRKNFEMPLIGVTGSNGKTTVKEMLKSILSQQGKVLATKGNLNNDIGLPLTLFELNSDCDYAVIEMGANHPGEIAYLADIAKPDIGVVSNAGTAHLEGFGSREGVARAKGELFMALGKGGTAIINRDDKFSDLWMSVCSSKKLTFGIESESADFRASDISLNAGGSSFDLNYNGESVSIELAIHGRHNIMNALAASAAASAAGISLRQVQAGLAEFRPVGGRLKSTLGYKGCNVIDDAYNANPESMFAAINVLSELDGVKILVIGDMFELGASADEGHKSVGKYAKEKAIDHLFCLGEKSKLACEVFGAGAKHYSELDKLVSELKSILEAGTTVLVKGSRGMRMERVLNEIV